MGASEPGAGVGSGLGAVAKSARVVLAAPYSVVDAATPRRRLRRKMSLEASGGGPFPLGLPVSFGPPRRESDAEASGSCIRRKLTVQSSAGSEACVRLASTEERVAKRLSLAVAGGVAEEIFISPAKRQLARSVSSPAPARNSVPSTALTAVEKASELHRLRDAQASRRDRAQVLLQSLETGTVHLRRCLARMLDDRLCRWRQCGLPRKENGFCWKYLQGGLEVWDLRRGIAPGCC